MLEVTAMICLFIDLLIDLCSSF